MRSAAGCALLGILLLLVAGTFDAEPLAIRVEALAGRLPLPPGVIDEPLLAEPAQLDAGRRRSALRIEASFGRRGRRVLEPPALILRDPLGLAERTIVSGEPDEVLVLPRVYPVKTTAAGGETTGAHARMLLTAAAETEIDGLRQHVEGTPASRIHWASLAKGHGLMERKMIAEA